MPVLCCCCSCATPFVGQEEEQLRYLLLLCLLLKSVLFVRLIFAFKTDTKLDDKQVQENMKAHCSYRTTLKVKKFRTSYLISGSRLCAELVRVAPRKCPKICELKIQGGEFIVVASPKLRYFFANVLPYVLCWDMGKSPRPRADTRCRIPAEELHFVCSLHFRADKNGVL